jgi:hypothetical protein
MKEENQNEITTPATIVQEQNKLETTLKSVGYVIKDQYLTTLGLLIIITRATRTPLFSQHTDPATQEERTKTPSQVKLGGGF